MIDDYRRLAVFVAIADTGSLSAAGRRLKLSTSVISHHLSRLEDRQGVTLFFRSTRSMSLTPEGKIALSTKVLVISHPCERKKVMIGTVPLIGLCLANFELLQVPEDPHDRHNHQRGSL